MKVVVLIKTFTNDSHINDKMIKEFRKVCDRRKSLKLSFVTLN